ncbi:GLS [Mytilus edulis]|uniref:GlsA n=1 Tax=Mytilus edulis TaxID=6550 RepID=A0A8S3UXV9_MYTED|nr:GLS [Mytilus edulis]
MNLSDSDGRTALHAAVERKQDSVIDFLINKCKVSPFVRWRDKRPFQLIKDGQDNQKLKEKLNKYMENQLNSESDLHKKTPDDDEDEDVKIVRILNSASRGDIRLIKAYDASQLTVSNYDKRTALHIAVSNNQEHIVEYLLKECGLTEEVQKAEDRYTLC